MYTSIGGTPTYFKSLFLRKGLSFIHYFVFVLHPRYYHACTCDLKTVLPSKFPIMPYAPQKA